MLLEYAESYTDYRARFEVPASIQLDYWVSILRLVFSSPFRQQKGANARPQLPVNILLGRNVCIPKGEGAAVM